MFHMIEKFVDSPSVISCEWDNENPRCFEEYLLSDMERQVLDSHNGQRPIWLMESTNIETGEIGASFHRDNPSAAFGWSENLMELIRKFAAKNAANNTTENEQEENTMDTTNTNETVTTETTTTEPETQTKERRVIGECRDCGCVIYEDDDYDTLPNGELVCNNCVDNYTRCERCEELVDNDDATFVRTSSWNSSVGDYYCPDCLENRMDWGHVVTCEECGEYIDSDIAETDDNGTCICPECFEDNYVRCRECGRIIRMDDALRSTDYYGNDVYYCDGCFDRREFPVRGTLYHYHEYKERHRPIIFYGDKNIDEDGINRARYSGVELETDTEDASNRGAYVDDLFDNFGEKYFFPATDCSLDAGGDYSGVELVMMPATLDYHLHEFPWEEITSVVRNNGYSSHDVGTCGLHVHVSRASLGKTETEQDLTIAKIAILFDRHWDKLVKFSRRKRFRYCQKLDAGFKRDDTTHEVVTKTKYSAQGHGKALNLENDDTVEFRIFRGTLNVNTIKATLEFVDNMVEYAMHTNLNDIMGADFADYALYKRYPELDTYLRQRSLMPAQMDEPDESAEE